MTELENRLMAAQKALAEALTDDNHDQLPDILASRDADLVALVAELERDDSLRNWARAYLDRDREIMAQAVVARDAVADKLAQVRKSRSVHRIYISEGLRR
jgi:succinate dehydrogenase flavin-adding protein (antitoxin of CptAB toxin-antitoxin module)